MILTLIRERRLKMYRGTTPTFVIEIPNTIDVETITSAYLSFEQHAQKILEIDLSGMAIDTVKNTLSVTLSQEQTLAFESGTMVYYQLRLAVGGSAYATSVWQVPAERIIKDGKI